MPHFSNRGVAAAGFAETTMHARAEQIDGAEVLLANLPGMAYRCSNDARGTLLYVSDGCRELLGVAPERLVGAEATNYEELVHPADRHVVQARLTAALASREGYTLRYRVLTAAGEKWVSDCGRGIYSADGRLETIGGFVSDISEAKRAEVVLREHSTMLSLAFNHARDMLLLARVDPGPVFRVLSVNRHYVEAVRAAGFDIRAEHLVGKTFPEIRVLFCLSDEVWNPLLRRYQEVVETRQPLHFDEATQTPNGVFHGRSTIAALCDERGECRFVLYMSTDVTDRKRAEAALRESEEKFAKAFRASPGAMAISEPGGRGFIEVNDGYVRMFGYSREELIGRSLSDLGIWSSETGRDQSIEVFEKNGFVSDMEVVRRRRDGTLVTCLLSAEPIELGGKRCIISALTDITGRRNTEQALRDSEAKFSTAFRASPGAMSISDVETQKFVEVNDGFCQMLGRTREEIIGRTAVEMALWNEAHDRHRFFERLLAESQVRDLEVAVRHRDGRAITCLVSARIIQLAGRAHLIAALHDLTERKRAEESRATLEAQLRQAQKLDALGQLAGGIAHDFNNILTGIIAYSDLAMMDAESPANVRRHLTTVRRASDRASDLVRQILMFSRKHARKREAVRLGAVVGEALKLLRSSLPKSIAFEERIVADSPTVLADATQIHQVVLNLCTNAAHAMRRTPGRLTVALERVQWEKGAADIPAGLQPGRYARLSVSDTGDGMDEATLARIFEPFFTTKAPGEGTGLGLPVVHGIVKDHDGMITVQSRVGEGTTVEIHLPEHSGAVASEPAEAAATPAGAGRRILFIDDEPVISGAATMILERFGFKVTAQTDPRSALTVFESAPAAFDVVVTDLTMPHLDGIEVARRIFKQRPEMPVILATGHSGVWTEESLRALGIRGLLMKPLTPAKLTRAIVEALAPVSR